MKILIAFGFLILLTACVTPYQAQGLAGGYSETQLNDDMYKVSYKGNGYTSKEHVVDMLLRRSAELTKQNGYKYFYILGSGTDTKQGSFSLPTTVNTVNNGTLTGSSYGNAYRYGNSINYNANYNGSYTGYSSTTINPGQTFNYAKYTTTVIIKMSNKKMEGAINAEIYLRNFATNH